ncbi:hypothetical protein LCGC14_0826650 [marine sediment metagenome]|uniref:Uncharacterized protein n=1 Tax=marine sediment metagenome TaxID=412755 RepID=A0A0F9S1Y3_9ZZZZ
MPDKICDVPCPVVDDKLEKVWLAIGKKVSLLVFFSIIGGLLIIAIYFGEGIGRRQEQVALQQGKTFGTLIDIQKSVSEIKGELKHLNGRAERDRR